MTISYNEIYNLFKSGRLSAAFKEINDLDSTSLNNFFNKFGELAAEESNGVKLFDRFCEKLPEAYIEKAYGKEKFESSKSASESTITYHQNLDAKTRAEQPSWVWAQVIRVSGVALVFFETIIFTFGISEAFSYNNHSWGQGDALLKPWHNIPTFVMVLSSFFLPEKARKVAITASVAIATISVVYPFINPYPARFKYAKNFTQAFAKGEFTSPTGRAAEVQQIADALRTNKKAMLIGKTGVGKTETIKAMVGAFQKDAQYQDLKDLNVLYVSAPDLAVNPWCERILFLMDDLGRHNKKTVLVLDEIHTLCEEKNKIIAERLKTLLDDETSGITYAIGITTEEEYKRNVYEPNPALARRFKTIPIEPMSSDQTEAILINRLSKKAPHMICEEGALQHIIEQCQENGSQPSSAMNILDECILKSENLFPVEQHKALEELKLKEENIRARSGITSAGATEVVTDFSKEISKAESEVKAAEDKISEFETIRKRYMEAKNLMLTSTKKCMLVRHILLPLETAYQSKGLELQVPTHLSKELVDKVIAEQAEQKQKSENLMRRGLQDSMARQQH